MAEDLSSKSVLVYDYGHNLELAIRLSREFGQVKYFKPWKDASPETLRLVVGDGIKGVKRVRNFFEHINNTDLFVFPNIYDGDLQMDLVSRDKRVWGSRMAEVYEYDREKFVHTLESLKLKVAPYKVCRGTTELKGYLEENEDQWVKVDFRGDDETWHHMSMAGSRRKIECLEYKFGAAKEHVKFTVFASIDSTVEMAYDGHFITGENGEPQFSDKGFFGYENKDLSHILRVIPYKKFPEELLEINEAFAPKLAERGYRGDFGTEVRKAEDGNYFLDLTARTSHPPGEIIWEAVANLGEFFYHGADGENIPLKTEHEFAAQAMLYSSWAKDNWQTVEIPDDIRRWVKLYNFCYADEAWQVVPHEVSSTYPIGTFQLIGCVVALGDSVEEAIDNVKKYCEDVNGFDTVDQLDSLSECLSRIKEGEEEGVKFADDVPEPAAALES